MHRTEPWAKDDLVLDALPAVSLAQFIAFAESVPTALALFDLRGTLVVANSALLRLYGERRYVGGLTYPAAFRTPPAAEVWVRTLGSSEQEPEPEEQLFTDFRNREIPVLASCRRARIDGEDMVVVSVVEISRQRAAHRHMFRLAYYDPVARLHNRAGFQRELGLRLAAGASRRIAIAQIDIDRFRSLVGALAEGESERILRSVADRLRASVPDSAVIARTGEDEFAILFEHVDSEEHASRIARELLELFRTPWRVGATVLALSACVGVAIAAHGDVGGCLRDAAFAVKAAKERGGASFAVFDAAMRRRAESILQAALDIGPAMDRGEFAVMLQPIVRLHDRQTVGHEALMRWHHPVRGLIPPGDFIPVAEQTGAIRAIDRYAFDQVVDLLASAAVDGYINVNVSARSLLDPDWIDAAIEVWRRAGGGPGGLRMEITETALLTDAGVVRTHLQRLVDAGIPVVLDDFGTGYSSLSHISSFPISGLKIDRSFVSRLNDAERDARIVRGIVALGNDLGLSVTAEGVESEAQCDSLMSLGCPLGQGLLFGVPSPISPAQAKP